MLITTVAFTGEAEMFYCQVLSSDFSVSPPCFVDMKRSLQYDTLVLLMTCCRCRPRCWLLLGDSSSVSSLVSPQSPGDHEQMKQVRRSLSKTGCAQRHYYYTFRDKRVALTVSVRLVFWEKKQFCCKCIQVEHDNERNCLSSPLNFHCGDSVF